MAIVRGRKGVLYRGTAGSQATTEVTVVGNVEVSIESRTTTNGETRADEGWESEVKTGRKMSMTFDLPNDPTSAHVIAFRTAAMHEDGMMSLWEKDQAGGSGPDADFVIKTCTLTKNLDGVQVYKVTAASTTLAGRKPTWS